MPDYTTTTENDKSVASVVMMGTLQTYFEYCMLMGCGLPSVTLLGEPSDWQKILARLDKLPQYGEAPTAWAKLLVPILKRMIATFYMPDSQELKDFWMRICYKQGEDGSTSAETLSGWITAFTYWGEEGNRLGISKEWLKHHDEKKFLELDGVEYPHILPKLIPDGIIKVPVTLEDDATSSQYKCTLVAGSIGMAIQAKGQSTTVQPRSGWWLLQDSVTGT